MIRLESKYLLKDYVVIWTINLSSDTTLSTNWWIWNRCLVCYWYQNNSYILWWTSAHLLST